jgi:hypothetical protein
VLEVRALRRQLDQRDRLEARLIGLGRHGPRARPDRPGDSAADVLIHGDRHRQGTGRPLPARRQPARKGNFVAINCGGLPETLFDSEIFGHEAGAFTGAGKRRIGKIEHASGGTLFLDEIESMPVPMQIKLLRVLQERTLERLGSNTPIPVDCRVIAATKEDLLGSRNSVSAPTSTTACRRHAAAAAAARAARGHPAAVRALPAAGRRPPRARRCRPRRRPHPATGRLRLAGQCARAAQRGRPLRARHRSRLAARPPPAMRRARWPKPSRPSSAP